MSSTKGEPTVDDLDNARSYMEDSEWTVAEFIEYLRGQDAQDFRKYWGSMDIDELEKILTIG